jgi:hypothetical protein
MVHEGNIRVEYIISLYSMLSVLRDKNVLYTQAVYRMVIYFITWKRPLHAMEHKLGSKHEGFIIFLMTLKQHCTEPVLLVYVPAEQRVHDVDPETAALR